ncbi:hypothetical protein NE237_010557 [Protea cynaroides]|uniref:Uncharacterized protein n=1 Tax=Protea cynaroides TaxID=273540 RepID=A0A9Q0KZJ1_9MAGN|nr:hypothetical protein NE237_010557 [Protea cynaroides]
MDMETDDECHYNYDAAVDIEELYHGRLTLAKLISCNILSSRDKMAFIMEFAENLIRRMMEDPQERDQSSHGMPRSAKSLDGGTLMMTSFSRPMRATPTNENCDWHL